jgi:hypothetical protein
LDISTIGKGGSARLKFREPASPQDLEPMSPEVEARMYESAREMEWRRLESTVRARS